MYTFAIPKSIKMNYRKEHVIYSLMWIVLYISPVMALYMRMSSNPDIDFSWKEIMNAWIFNTVWLVLFAIHNFLLTPILIVKRRTWLYSLLSVALLLCAVVTLRLMRPMHDRQRMRRFRPNAEMFDDEACRKPMGRQRDTRAARRGQWGRHHVPEFMPDGPFFFLGPGEMVAALGGLLLMGMNLGVKLYFKSQEDEKVLVAIERQSLERQLEYLKYQVNPRFFMNTLNNIHALVDIDPERAKNTIVELSKMMRYILYEGNNKLISLTRELQFIDNYVTLMRMRYTDKVSIRFAKPDVVPDLTLPPLLLIIFVENAFKHGISYRTESFIDINVAVEQGRLLFACSNSTRQHPADEGKKGGMGLANVRRRLDLLFPGKYTLDIVHEDDVYNVRLDMPLSQA